MASKLYGEFSKMCSASLMRRENQNSHTSNIELKSDDFAVHTEYPTKIQTFIQNALVMFVFFCPCNSLYSDGDLV